MSAQFTLRRLQSGVDSTAGELIAPDGMRLCATLERGWSNNRPRESRVPAGEYPLRLKRLGASHFDKEYQRKFGEWHLGMVEIYEVPERSEILLHMGNTHHHTWGCVLLGARAVPITPDAKNYFIPPGESRDGYLIAYPRLLAAVRAGDAQITVIDPVLNGAALVA